MPTTLAGIPVPIDYTSRDYESFRADLLALAPTFTPEWTDQSDFDLGVTLVELFSYVGDVLSYYIDRAANECFLPTATQRRSVILLGRLVGYELQPATSAIVAVSFTCTGAGVIPAGALVSTDPPSGETAVTFETRTATNVLGAGTVSVDCIQGTTITGEILGSGTGLPDQTLHLAQTPLSYDPDGTTSLRVYVDEGAGPVQYDEVLNFLGSLPTDRHYTVRIDENDVVAITFGDGVNGRTVTAGIQNVTATYRVGGGEASNAVGTGEITRLVTPLGFVSTITNAAPPQGGQDKESVEAAKVSIPADIRTNDRGVAHSDYETLAEQVAGVAQAKAVWGVGPFEEVVYVSASGPDPIASGTWDPYRETGTGLIGQVGNYLRSRRATPIRLVVRPPSGVPITMVLAIQANRGFFRDDVQERALSAILEYVRSHPMGEDLVLIDLGGVLEDLDGVDKVRFSAFRRKPTVVLTNPDPYFFAGTPDTTWTVSTTDVTDYGAYASSFVAGTSILPTVEETLEVRFISPTRYRVRGSRTGRQAAIGTVGSTWTNDLGNVSLLAMAGAVPNFNGNQYRIGVGAGIVGPQIVILDGPVEIATVDEDDIAITMSGGIA